MITPALIAALAGPFVGAVLSIILYLSKKNLEQITNTLEKVENNLVELRVEIPRSYVTKDELIRHMQSEDVAHSNLNTQLALINQELRTLRLKSNESF